MPSNSFGRALGEPVRLCSRIAGSGLVSAILRAKAIAASLQLALRRDLVDDAELLRLLGRHVTAGGDHVERRLRADQARQPLRAAGAGEDADQHLGQPDLGARHRDPVMAGERGFETAAERIAVDRRDHRLRALVHHVVVRGGSAAAQPALAELADIGAGDKAAPGADQHHRLDRRVGIALVERSDDALRHPRRQRVHRRIVDGDDADIAVSFSKRTSSPSAIIFSSDVHHRGSETVRRSQSTMRLMPSFSTAELKFSSKPVRMPLS